MLKRLLFVVLLAIASAAQATVYSLPWGPKPQFVDANGAPMSGGTLLTFVGGSSTPQVTYTDSTGGTSNPTTITLNTRGETPSEVWLTGGVSYKFVLKDSSGTTIWTVDNVAGVNDTSSSFSEWVTGPTPTFVGATSFTLAGDQTQTFTVGRRVRTTNSGGTIYSTITASAFVVSTTVTVVNDSGVLDSGLSAVAYGLLSAANSSVPSVKLSSGNWTITNTLAASSAFTLSGTVSPAQITSNQNDYNPTSLASASTLRLNTDASRNITGLAGGADGRIITIVNVGTNPIVLTNQDALSSAANRFLLRSDTTLAADQAITLRYDNTTARWRHLTGGVTKQATRQVFTSGSGTYTTPTGATRINVRLVGGGGPGLGSGPTPGAISAGNNTTFSTLTGTGGPAGTAGSTGVVGGTATGGDINIPGGGGGGVDSSAANNTRGGAGGGTPLGGGGPAIHSGTGGSGATNSGGGGAGGGGNTNANVQGVGGGGGGGYVEKLILPPAATYSYAVGASSTGGTAGVGGSAGGAGAAGIIIVDEWYD